MFQDKAAEDNIKRCFRQFGRAQIVTDGHIEISGIAPAQLKRHGIEIDACELEVDARQIKRPTLPTPGL
jgi:hypothetical protein